MSELDPGRRRVMQAVGAGLLLPGLAPAVIASVKDRPQLTDGVQSGDLPGDGLESQRPSRADGRGMGHPHGILVGQ